jgi:hypothetical protein
MRPFKTSCLFWVVLMLLPMGTGCAIAPPASDANAGEDLPILWEKSGSYSRFGRPARVLVRDRATLSQIPIADIPVDFHTQMVLVAALGPTPTSDYGVRITRVWREGSRVRAQEREIHPGLSEGHGLDPASPWTAVVVPRSDLNVQGYSVDIPNRLVGGRWNR